MIRLPQQVVDAVEQSRDHLDPALAGWVRNQLARGYTPHAVVLQLVENRRPIEVATLLVGLAIKGLALAPASHTPAQPDTKSGPADAAHSIEHAVCLDGAKVRKLLTVGAAGMELALYDGLITDSEIEHLKRAAEPSLKRSTVLAENFGNADSAVRTSRDAFLGVGRDPTVAALERRISAVTGIPVAHGEGLQILHYTHAAEYQPHFDFFDPASQQEHAIMAASGNRVGTMILYLGDVERGGATYFPKLDLAVHPHRGHAVWFRYMRQDGMLDERSQHAGMPIIEGEKWIATKWFRERVFRN